MKCGNVKAGLEEANSRHEDLSRSSVSHKGTPTSTLLKYSRRVLLSSNQVSSVNTITVTLIPLSTKELAHEGWGSPRPLHRVVDAAPHQAIGSLTCRRATNAPRGRRTEIQVLTHSRTTHKAVTPCSLTHLRANLALTLSKVC